MNKDSFETAKEQLLALMQRETKIAEEAGYKGPPYESLARILQEYTYENRLQKKGKLTRIVNDNGYEYDLVSNTCATFDYNIH